MTPRLLSLALAAALAAAAPSSFALGLSPDPTGDALLLPYFTTGNGQATLLTVTNHSDAAKAVRVVFAEARAGRALLTMNLYLAPRDTWTGALAGGDADTPARLFANDASCTVGSFTDAGVPLRDFAYAGANADGLGSDAARTQRGFIEVIEMGELSGGARDSVLAAQCDALAARLSVGSWSTAPNGDVGVPTGGVSAQAQVVDVAEGYAFRVAAQAVRGFSGAPRHGAPGASVNEVRLTRPTLAAGATHFEVEGWGRVPAARAADAASLLFMTRELEAPYSIADSLDASAQFVVTYPTRHAHVDAQPGGTLPAGSAARAPFGPDADSAAGHCEAVEWRILRDDGSVAGTQDGLSCASVVVHHFYDGDELGTYLPGSVDTLGVDSGRAVLDFEAAQRRLAFTPDGATQERFAAGLPAVGQSITTARNANAQPGVLAAYAVAQPAVPQRRAVDGSATPQPASCQDPLVAPPGWTLQQVPWETAWSAPDGAPAAAFPNSVGFPVPLGANKGTIKTIPFTPAANQTLTITWDVVQANPSQGYPRPRPANTMLLAVSPCAGDVRAIAAGGGDRYLQRACRTVAGGASLFLSTRSGTNPDAVCQLEAGRQYYLTVAPVDPSNGLSPGEHTCSTSAANSVDGCEVQAVHRGN